MNNVTNQVAFLRTTREFPEEIHQLTVEVNRTYVDIANAVNSRTIGIYPINRPALTGDAWYITKNQKQQTFRQIYTFTAAGNIPHGINILGISQLSPNSYGSFTDGTNYYGCIYASNVAIAGQVSFYITPNSAGNVLDGNIVVLSGAGAPAITSGIIVLEWITNV